MLVFKTSAFNHSATSPDATRQAETNHVHPYDNDIIELNWNNISQIYFHKRPFQGMRLSNRKDNSGLPDNDDGSLQMTIRMGIGLHTGWMWVNKHYQQDERDLPHMGMALVEE